MLVAAAVCPQTPLIVPRLPELRTADLTAVAALRDARPDLLVVVGGAETTRAYDGAAGGSLRPWGFDVTVGEGPPVLPLSLTVGRLLLDGEPVPARSVAYDATPAECRAIGAELAAAGRVALLVMADGSACLTPRAPGRYDEAAGPYNALVAGAVGRADAAALAALDPREADRLWVTGRAALQVLAGAAEGTALTGRLLMEAAPYGVGYFAGVWT
ncbi:hypothetical protein DMB42_12025 [Nonomuraea sp. WAC 01424]|uniref:hypothetical protein n=1 Tax=Nonomuraea sp. WAC 01424 TaxID=2203200 RepID=UPI000F76EBCB|nr:hypothetical protein [Nonomuraea sp. WAC 01424]RSN12897.1 hypothetical protein DMB42_12025 [Nonomuraea sp. WAC 01424]